MAKEFPMTSVKANLTDSDNLGKIVMYFSMGSWTLGENIYHPEFICEELYATRAQRGWYRHMNLFTYDDKKELVDTGELGFIPGALVHYRDFSINLTFFDLNFNMLEVKCL